MWETQGPVADRTRERLGTSDRGIVMLREVMEREMDKVAKGQDPMGVIRDSNRAVVDTNLMKSITMEYPTGIVAKSAVV
jgi:5,5'-dehydrodivanillate O-demethylase